MMRMKLSEAQRSNAEPLDPSRLGRTRFSPPSVFRATLHVALLVVFGLLAGVFLRQASPVYDAGVTGQGGSATNKVGFYVVETLPGQEPFRWTSGYAFVQMPWAYHAAPAYMASVRLRSDRLDLARPLTFLANERPLTTVTPTVAYRTYSLLLPPPANGEPQLRFALQTEPFQPPENPRPLGVMTTAIRLWSLPHHDLEHSAALALAPALLWGWLALRGARPHAALLVAGGLAAALAALFALGQPGPLPFETLAALVTLAAAGAAFVARETAARLGLTLLGALAGFSSTLWPPWLTDDAFISFRYAQNLVAGRGLVYNIGERVEGFTNFLWTVLAALALALGGEIVALTYAAGVVLALALILATYAAARRLVGAPWALAAALFVATSQSLLIYTARGGGLETGLFALLALLGAEAYLRASEGGQRGAGRRMRVKVGAIPSDGAWRSAFNAQWALVGLVFALATLTRPEGALLLALTALHFMITRGRGQRADGRAGFHPSSLIPHPSSLIPLLPALLVYGLIVAPLFAWRLSYYGDLLPNTFYVKTGGGPLVWLRGLEYAGSFALAFGPPLLCALLTIRPLRALPGSSSWISYLALICGVFTLYIIAVGGDHFPGHRFLVPLVPLLAILAAEGLRRMYTGILPQITRIDSRSNVLANQSAQSTDTSVPQSADTFVPRLALAALLLVSVAWAITRSEPYDHILAGNDESLWLWAEIGWWLADHTPPDATVAASGAGAIAFHSDRTTIDLLGLTEQHIARLEVTDAGSGAAGHEKRDPAYVLDVRRPNYIPRIWDEYFGGEAALRDRYELITATTRYGRTVELWQRRD
jgi:hypothetical protein